MAKVPTEHYRKHPSGIECIQVTRHMNFNLGNSVKYIWRADLKGKTPVQDLKKATWYLLDQLYLETGDTEYINIRNKIENYSASIKPLNGLAEYDFKSDGIELDEAEVRRTDHKSDDLEC